MPLGLLSEAMLSPAPPQRSSTSPRRFAASTCWRLGTLTYTVPSGLAAIEGSS